MKYNAFPKIATAAEGEGEVYAASPVKKNPENGCNSQMRRGDTRAYGKGNHHRNACAQSFIR